MAEPTKKLQLLTPIDCTELPEITEQDEGKVLSVVDQKWTLTDLPESEPTTIDNIDPSKVIFPEGKQTTYAIGNVVLENGIGTLIEPGGNLNDFFSVFMTEMTPSVSQPSVSITASNNKAYEVGTEVDPTYSATFDDGNYQYGYKGNTSGATGVEVTSWEISDTASNKASTASGTMPKVKVIDGINYKITAKANYDDGEVPVTNTGKEYTDGQIKAGSKSATSGAITGYRNSFYGTLTAKSDITSSIVRGLSKSGKTLANGNSFTVTIPVGALRVVIAYPATLRNLTSVKDVNGMNAEIVSGFSSQTLKVEGANGYTAIDYKIYTMDFASANDTANKFTVTI